MSPFVEKHTATGFGSTAKKFTTPVEETTMRFTFSEASTQRRSGSNKTSPTLDDIDQIKP